MSNTIQTSALEEQGGKASLLVGKPLRRKEDRRFLVGSSRYVDDIGEPGTLHAFVVRSPYAHARIESIDTRSALELPGVHYVFTSSDLSRKIGALPAAGPSGNHKPVPRPPLAVDVVNYVGEPVAFVVADNRYVAEDSAELVQVRYFPLDTVVNPEPALRSGTTPIHPSLKDNVGNYLLKESGDVDGAFKKADKVITLDVVNQRVAPSPMEARAIVASYDSGREFLTAWMSNQQPFETRAALADVLRLDENRVRVIAPDVGGAFGAKCYLYPEDVLACHASIVSGRPVKWVETRTENLSSMFHGRGQFQHAEVALKKDGSILGLKVRIISDSGAYASPETFGDPEITLDIIPSVYDVRSYRAELFCVYTNKVSFDAYRGAGRPEAIYLIERILDRVASELDIDPVEVRLKNFVPKNAFPFRSVTGYTYESADYQTNLRAALELANYNKWRSEQRKERTKEGGRLIGIGICTYIDISSWAPDFPQTASITVGPSGKVKVVCGTSPHGQGHETPFAQIVADELGVDVDDVTVVYGDTDRLAWGTTTGGSRSGALGGSAVLLSARKIRDKMAGIAANILGADSTSLTFKDGKIFQKYNIQKSLGFGEVASAAYIPSKLPRGMEPVLFAFSAFSPENWTFPYGTHVAVAEVERETGAVKILEYVAIDDVGKMINPMIVEGQVHGGVMQGVGQALLEGVVYDESGALLTSNFMDYQIPASSDSFPIKWSTTFTPTKANPLGVKGVGENGSIAGTPAVVNAVEDALSVVRSKIKTMPLTPEYVLSLLKGKEGDSERRV